MTHTSLVNGNGRSQSGHPAEVLHGNSAVGAGLRVGCGKRTQTDFGVGNQLAYDGAQRVPLWAISSLFGVGQWVNGGRGAVPNAQLELDSGLRYALKSCRFRGTSSGDIASPSDCKKTMYLDKLASGLTKHECCEATSAFAILVVQVQPRFPEQRVSIASLQPASPARCTTLGQDVSRFYGCVTFCGSHLGAADLWL